MATERDKIIDRRLLKRRLLLWQILALVLLAGVVVALAGRFSASGQPHIARVTISGVIADDFARDEMLAQLAENQNAKAVLIRINSPGGTVAGSEALYAGIRALAEKKPVAAFISTIGASGGYITALAADRIFARDNALTGSIGVIFQSPELSGLFEKLGIGVQEVKTSPIKGGPPLHAPMSDEQRAVIQSMIDDAYEWFVGLVAERRSLDDAEARRLGDGRVYTGRQAAANGLVDALGSERDAVAWLKSQEGVPADLPVQDVDITDYLRWFSSVTAWLGWRGEIAERLTLDGLLALWHPY